MKSLSVRDLEILAGRFGLLSSATRLRILSLLSEREMSVGELLSLTGQKQPNLSKQLSLLHAAGFLRRRLDGVHAYFSITTAALARICETMTDVLRSTGFERAQERSVLAS